MKTKFVVIYALAGAAFLAVSLWVFLSRGRSARAVRSKYKLGGLMLTAAGMLAAASCKVPGPGAGITCYEPVMQCYDTPMMNDILSFSIKGKGGRSVSAGDVIVISIASPSYPGYICRICTGEKEPSVLQMENFYYDGSADTRTMELVIKQTGYHGPVFVEVKGYVRTEPGGVVNESDLEHGKEVFIFD